jgi:hypothetical protein
VANVSLPWPLGLGVAEKEFPATTIPGNNTLKLTQEFSVLVFLSLLGLNHPVFHSGSGN